MELERNESRSWRPMPIRPYLDGHKFDGETSRQMGIAFEMALASLRATPDWNDPIRAAFAQRIIALAKAGERDPERLCEGALQQSVDPSAGRELSEGGRAAKADLAPIQAGSRGPQRSRRGGPPFSRTGTLLRLAVESTYPLPQGIPCRCMIGRAPHLRSGALLLRRLTA
jgi:hypothetical protein